MKSLSALSRPAQSAPEVAEPPIFPRWMRAVDPVLEAEHDNALFEAFRLRRRVYKPRLRDRLRNRATWLRWGGVAGALLAVAALVVATLWLTQGAAIVLLVLFVAVASGLAIRRPNRTTLMPRRLAEVFSRGGIAIFAARDIYLMGVGGQKLAEAMYMELRERQVRLVQIVTVVLLVGIPFGSWVSGQVFGYPYSFIGLPGLAVLACSLFFLWAIRRFLIAAGMETARHEVAVVRLGQLAHDSDLRGYTEMVGRRTAEMIVFLVVGVAVLVYTLFLATMAASFATGGGSGSVVMQHRLIVAICAVMVGWALVLWPLAVVIERAMRAFVPHAIHTAGVICDRGLARLMETVPDR